MHYPTPKAFLRARLCTALISTIGVLCLPLTAVSAEEVPSAWRVSAVAPAPNSYGETLTISATYEAPSSQVAQFVTNVEIRNPYDTKVASWSETLAPVGIPLQRTYSWPTAGLGEGQYTLTQSVRSTDGLTILAQGAPLSVTLLAAPVKDRAQHFRGMNLYKDPNFAARTTAKKWDAAVASGLGLPSGTTAEDADLMRKLGDTPVGIWVGDWVKSPEAEVRKHTVNAAASGTLPVLVAYNLPYRDCGNYSQGGAASAEDYRAWIRSFAAGIGLEKAMVVLEPDSLTTVRCVLRSELYADPYTDPRWVERAELLNYAVNALEALPNVDVFIAAGNPNTTAPESEIAKRLRLVGIANAQGFAINVSVSYRLDLNTKYGWRISDSLGGGPHFVIDTSRAPITATATPTDSDPKWAGQIYTTEGWCNPQPPSMGGITKLGTDPTTKTGLLRADAYLYIKRVGQSDGLCNGGPAAGTFWPEYALGLARAAAAAPA